jgi:hypothetical protein
MKTTANHLATFWYYSLRVLVVLAVFFFLWHRNWVDAVSAALILVLMLAPAFLRKKYDLFIPFELEFAISSFVYVTLFLGSLRDYYERISWWDTLLHFQSGVLLGMVGFVLIYILNQSHTGKLALSPFFISFFAASFSMAVGVVWEIYEYAIDTFLGFNMQRNGLPDTMHDLIFNTVGALAVAVAGLLWSRWRMRVPFTPRRLAGSPYDRSTGKAADA